jgi:CubicO group peptidase (beta-lactamase class C family)
MYRSFIKTLIAISITFNVLQVWGQNTQLEKEINNLLLPILQKNNLPSLAGGIVTIDSFVASGAVGVRKAGTNIPVTLNDKWHLGSDTKAMTAMLIGALVEQGKLKWETTIEEVFPEYATSLQSELRKVTLLHLLSHRAGLVGNINWGLVPKIGTILEQRQVVLKMAAATKLLSDPGSKYNYSNLGYVIAGAMAEKVTNTSWENLITKTIFEPLGMKSVGFGGTGTPGEIDQPWGHKANGKPVSGNGPQMDNPSVIGPAGTVHCTLKDWSKFIIDQLRGAKGDTALLQPETYKKLHTPLFGGNYSLGWLITQRDWGGGTVLTHAGSNNMNYALVWMAPNRNFAVLICTNQGGSSAQKACDEAAGKLIEFHLKNKGAGK